jgi:choline dehydrogenase
MVTKVLIDDNKIAIGVKYLRNGEDMVAMARREVVLSGGAINSPQLLMLSGVGDPEELNKHGIPVVHPLPGVGQNLQDHISSGAAVFTVDQPVAVIQERLEKLPYVLRWMVDGSGPLTLLGGIEAIAFIKTKYANQTDDWPDIQFHYASGSAASDGGTHLSKGLGFTKEMWDSVFQPLVQKDTFTIFPTLLRPKSRGYIKLRSANPLDHPVIDPKYYSHPEDIRVMTEGVKIALRVANSKAYKQFGTKLNPNNYPHCLEFQLYSDEYWACCSRYYSSTIFHPAGTAKMGVANDPMAVVDPELRVYGVKNLRVVDASIMPTVVSGNTNAPVIMIGEKAADLIKQQWKMRS